MSTVEFTHTTIGQEEGEHLAVLGDRYRVIADGEQTGGALALVEVTVAPGSGVPPHVDNREAIGWYVLDGSLQFMVEGEDVVVRAGGWIFSPKGVLHTFHNATPVPARALLLALPSGLEGLFREAGASLDAEQAPAPPTDADVARVMAAAPRYGVDIVTG